MIRMMKAVCVAALVVLAGLGGCIQYDQGTTVFPDGSGKVVMKVAFKKSMIKMIEELAKSFGGQAPDGTKMTNPFDEFTNAEELSKNSEGISAWKVGAKEEDADWIRLTNIGYFEDVNKVKLYSSKPDPAGGKQRTLSFGAKLEKTDAGWTLSMADESRKELKELPGAPGAPGGDNPELAKAMLEMMKPMLEGMKIAMSVTVPGPVTKAVGFMETKDRTVSIGFDGKAMMDMMANPEGDAARKLKALTEAKEAKVTWTENKVAQAEIDAFRKEMEDAKAAWKKALEESKKKATKE